MLDLTDIAYAYGIGLDAMFHLQHPKSITESGIAIDTELATGPMVVTTCLAM